MSIFLILSTATIGAVDAATSTAEKKQDSRLKAIESSISKILARLTAIENKLKNVQTPPYSATYGKFQESFPDIQNGVAMTITIDVPVTSNVYLSASGLASNDIEPYLQVDNGMIPDWAYSVPKGPFSIARVVQLNKGTHKIDLHVTGNPPDMYGVTMSAIVNEKGNLDCGSNTNCVPQ